MGILGPEVIAKPVDPDAAIEFWRQRAKLTDAEAKALGAGAKQRAFYVSGLARRDLVQLVSDGIQTALENGETLADFKGRIAGAIAAEGWHGYRVENIFRTNMQTAYAAGRYKKMQAVKASRPYWQYLAILDKRTRPGHWTYKPTCRSRASIRTPKPAWNTLFTFPALTRAFGPIPAKTGWTVWTSKNTRT